MTTKHPAKFTDSILEVIRPYINPSWKILDPFAGTGKLKSIVNHDNLFLNEIEWEWGVQGKPANVNIGNALMLPYCDGAFDCVISSCVYGNRMSDNFEAKDTSHRNTYTHVLGRKLHSSNSGTIQWGEKYRQFHTAAWLECIRVLKADSIFILNVSNHIRNGKEMMVSEWHLDELTGLGFYLQDHIKVSTPRQKFGANADKRVNHENVYIMKLHKGCSYDW